MGDVLQPDRIDDRQQQARFLRENLVVAGERAGLAARLGGAHLATRGRRRAPAPRTRCACRPAPPASAPARRRGAYRLGNGRHRLTPERVDGAGGAERRPHGALVSCAATSRTSSRARPPRRSSRPRRRPPRNRARARRSRRRRAGSAKLRHEFEQRVALRTAAAHRRTPGSSPVATATPAFRAQRLSARRHLDERARAARTSASDAAVSSVEPSETTMISRAPG